VAVPCRWPGPVQGVWGRSVWRRCWRRRPRRRNPAIGDRRLCANVGAVSSGRQPCLVQQGQGLAAAHCSRAPQAAATGKPAFGWASGDGKGNLLEQSTVSSTCKDAPAEAAAVALADACAGSTHHDHQTGRGDSRAAFDNVVTNLDRSCSLSFGTMQKPYRGSGCDGCSGCSCSIA
jgi:hypothetical protein